jgi:imidazole glycerol-phosphate synthase subunit HisH
MMPHSVSIIDYGVGNLYSVRKAFEYLGAEVNVTTDPDTLTQSSHIVLPGVGAFGDGMSALAAQEMPVALITAAKKGISVLAICLGMQMLLDESEEFGLNKGIGLIAGRVIPVPGTTTAGVAQKIPHIGWNKLIPPDGSRHFTSPLLADTPPNSAVYFVHSFMASPNDKQSRLADCDYGGHRVAAVIGRDNVLGCQFHPEKSGEVGLKILKRFLAL